MNNLDFRKNETMSGRKRRSEGQTPLLIDLTSDDEVSGGETAPESPAIQRSTRSGIIQTRRADYEPTNRKKPKILEKDTKNLQKLIQTKNNFEKRLETKFENEFESESGISKLKKSKSMKLWNGEKDAQEREKQCWCDIHVRYAICDKDCDMILVFQKNIAKMGVFLKNFFETRQSDEF